jgi:hypothetical protein
MTIDWRKMECALREALEASGIEVNQDFGDQFVDWWEVLPVEENKGRHYPEVVGKRPRVVSITAIAKRIAAELS